MSKDVDQVLEEIGSFGRFQKRLVLVLALCMGFAVTFHPLLSTFTAAEPPWRCTKLRNNTWCPYNDSFIAGDDLYKARCDMPRHAWEYDDAYTSVVTEWSLYCDRSILGSVSSSMFFVGFLIGVYVIGTLSDRFGRKPLCFLCLVSSSIAGVCCAVAPELWFYCVCKVISGGFSGGAMLILWIIAAECSGVKDRGTSSTLLWYGWTVFLLFLALLAYGIRNWRYLSLACSLPGLLTLLLWRLVPETPRWLVVHGRIPEATSVLKNVASLNKTEMPREPIGLPDMDEENKKSGNILDLFRTREMATRTLIQCFAWFMDSMVYYGVSMSSTIIGGDVYLNFFLVSLVEIPAHLFSVWYINKFGRKSGVIGGLIVAAIGAICAMALNNNPSTGFTIGRLIFALLAKFSIIHSFNCLYVFTGELMPTVIRNVGMGACSAFARIGSFSASYIIYLQQVETLLPFGIMGFGSLVAGFLCFTLPETMNQPTPELLQRHAKGRAPKQDNNNEPETIDTRC